MAGVTSGSKTNRSLEADPEEDISISVYCRQKSRVSYMATHYIVIGR